MVISEIESGAQPKEKKAVRYEPTGHSHVIVQCQSGLEELLCGNKNN